MLFGGLVGYDKINFGWKHLDKINIDGFSETSLLINNIFIYIFWRFLSALQ